MKRNLLKMLGIISLGLAATLTFSKCSGGSSTPTPTPNPTYKTCYLDADHDGQGDENSSLDVLKTEACPIGYVENSDDPNDSDWTCYKGAGELVYTKIMSDEKEQLFTYKLENKLEERLTTSNLWDRYPRNSLDGKEVFFTRAGSGFDKIYKINKETKLETLLISKLGYCRYPSVSPDGTQIAFAFYNGSDWDIYTANSSNGSGETLVVGGVSNDTMPFWGSDGKINFRTNRDGNMESYRINPTNLDLERITQTIDNENTVPVLSPNKNYIAVGIGPTDQENIFIYPNNGNFPLDETARSPPLTTDNKNNNYLSWSKDSDKLVHDSYDYDNNTARIYMINKDGSNKASPFNDEENRHYPDWDKN